MSVEQHVVLSTEDVAYLHTKTVEADDEGLTEADRRGAAFAVAGYVQALLAAQHSIRPKRGRPVKARPTYEQIAEALHAVLDSGLYELELRQDGQAVADPVWRLAKALEKAGLIDAKGVRP